MPSYPFYIVDVFAEKPFAGNQLAVFIGNPSTETMQTLALEMNYSETTFITSNSMQSNGGWDVRIFTPATEVPFAGHPTLGTAYIIGTQLEKNPVPEVILNLDVGQIPVRFETDGNLWMKQNPPVFGEIIEASVMAEALNLPVSAMDTHYPVQIVSTGLPSITCPLKSRADVQNTTINLAKFQALLDQWAVPHLDMVLVFCPEPVEADHHLHARMLWLDELGIVEDPATGSANGNLAGWLARHRYFDKSTIQVEVEQGYGIRRPSVLRLIAEDKGETVDIQVGGRVHLIATGEMFVDED